VRRERLQLATPIVLAVLVVLSGCERRTQLVPASADSTHAAVDSFAVYAREASERWESGVFDEAAGLSARVVREALVTRPNAPWVERTRGILDSLGIAAEVEGGDRAEVMNLFSRTDPQGESWPYLVWHDHGAPRFQAVEGHGLHLMDVALRGFGNDSAPAESAQAAVLWGRRVGGGQEPRVMVWRYERGGRWDLLQTLGPDSLGGTGSGEFAAGDSSSDLTVRTYRPTPYFDECATCPHVFHERRFAWGDAGFSRMEERAVPSTYSTFTAFIAALVANDRDRAATLVVDKSLIDFAKRFEWNMVGRGRWRAAPATDESAIEMVFLRGSRDAYRVRFEAQEGDWVIAGFEPTARALE
jgi:hypothetical protein